MSLAPLQTVNDKQLNSRTIHTPIKKNNLISENKENYHNSNNKRVDNGFNQKQQPPQKRKKEKLSSLCKTPPSLIKTRGRNYHRGHSLGEGGFARCFQMKDDSGKIFAAKTVAKISIKSEKTRKKLLSEIQIHKSMRHPNIVQFIDCFEDDVNVYILLEICPNGSLMDLLKKRKLLTEPEVRFFTTQICGAIKYMHSRRVIHRDLKLGNIFFDKNFNLKVGDFGLAATLGNDRERKYTICGTPNYIAPEVLMGKHSGHSYEVDIWSIGVMMYALLIGKPPFQSRDVNTIYERIKCRDFNFPSEKPISSQAKLLIQDILSIDPLERPSIKEIMDYLWFRDCFPPSTRDDVMTTIPCYESEINENDSIMNYRYCMDMCGLLDYTAYNERKQLMAQNNTINNDVEDDMTKYHSITTVLPSSISPNGTRSKYREVIDIETQRRFNELARQSRIRKAQQESIKKNLVPTSTNVIKSEISLRILASECHLTLNGILEAEAQKKMGGLPQSRLPKIKHPMIVTKWVDYSNKHGFSYQLSTEDIGVLFNNGCTVLRLADAEEFWYISYDNKEGWIASHYLLSERPRELNRYLEVVDFFATYMKANLSRVSTFGREEYHKDDVFLRRYTRFKPFVMFELSDGTFQFNFKDHHKLAVSDGGKLVTYISPSHESFTYPLVEVLKLGNIPNYPECKFMEKLTMIKEGLKQKSAIVRVEQTEV